MLSKVAVTARFAVYILIVKVEAIKVTFGWFSFSVIDFSLSVFAVVVAQHIFVVIALFHFIA
jgi:hypothetical protein